MTSDIRSYKGSFRVQVARMLCGLGSLNSKSFGYMGIDDATLQ